MPFAQSEYEKDFAGSAALEPDSIARFRHLLERQKLGKKLLATVNEHLKRNGIKISNGTNK